MGNDRSRYEKLKIHSSEEKAHILMQSKITFPSMESRELVLFVGYCVSLTESQYY